MKANIQDLLQFLKDNGFPAELQDETGQAYMIFKEKERDFPLFFRFYKGGEFMQLIVFFPYQIEEKIVPEIARLLHLLNKELDIPGFGMDEIDGVAYFRIMMNLQNQEVDEELLKKYIESAKLACKTFGPTVEAVVVGATTVDTLIKNAQKAAKGQ